MTCTFGKRLVSLDSGPICYKTTMFGPWGEASFKRRSCTGPTRRSKKGGSSSSKKVKSRHREKGDNTSSKSYFTLPGHLDRRLSFPSCFMLEYVKKKEETKIKDEYEEDTKAVNVNDVKLNAYKEMKKMKNNLPSLSHTTLKCEVNDIRNVSCCSSEEKRMSQNMNKRSRLIIPYSEHINNHRVIGAGDKPSFEEPPSYPFQCNFVDQYAELESKPRCPSHQRTPGSAFMWQAPTSYDFGGSAAALPDIQAVMKLTEKTMKDVFLTPIEKLPDFKRSKDVTPTPSMSSHFSQIKITLNDPNNTNNINTGSPLDTFKTNYEELVEMCTKSARKIVSDQIISRMQCRSKTIHDRSVINSSRSSLSRDGDISARDRTGCMYCKLIIKRLDMYPSPQLGVTTERMLIYKRIHKHPNE